MKERGVIDESHPVAPPNLSEKGKTEMSKLAKPMTPLCSIYDVDIRILMQKQELSFKEDLSGNADFVLADALYKAQTDQNDEHGYHDVFG